MEDGSDAWVGLLGGVIDEFSVERIGGLVGLGVEEVEVIVGCDEMVGVVGVAG